MSIIEYIVNTPHMTEEMRQQWLIDFGTDPYRETACYRNLETGEEYHHLAGGFTWPGRKPGFALVLAVMQSEPVTFRALEEVEHDRVPTLLLLCAGLREKYSPPNDANRLLCFYGNSGHRLSGFLADLPDDKRFWLMLPTEFEQAKNSLELYANQIKSAGRRLILGQCDGLKKYLAGAPDSFVGEGEDDFPAIAALGYPLHSLTKSEPWVLRENIGSYIDE
jgi:hypothetical protein